jgi:hypothetical protein
MQGGLTAAQRLGLTNAVPAKIEYAPDGTSRIVEADGWQIQFSIPSESCVGLVVRLAWSCRR